MNNWKWRCERRERREIPRKRNGVSFVMATGWCTRRMLAIVCAPNNCCRFSVCVCGLYMDRPKVLLYSSAVESRERQTGQLLVGSSSSLLLVCDRLDSLKAARNRAKPPSDESRTIRRRTPIHPHWWATRPMIGPSITVPTLPAPLTSPARNHKTKCQRNPRLLKQNTK